MHMTKSRRRVARRPVGRLLLDVAIAMTFLFAMINFVLPWAGDSIAAGFLESIEQSR